MNIKECLALGAIINEFDLGQAVSDYFHPHSATGDAVRAKLDALKSDPSHVPPMGKVVASNTPTTTPNIVKGVQAIKNGPNVVDDAINRLK